MLGTGQSRGLAVGEVDGDADLDVFVANTLGPNKVWLNDGLGEFTASAQDLGDHTSYGVALGASTPTMTSTLL